MFDVIVIGAGASGLYCTAHLKGLNVLVLEKNKRVGMKVLASGSGQCNLTHGGYIRHFYDRYNQKKAFVKPALTAHDNQAVIDFFESRELSCIERSDGKVFPASLSSQDVVNVLKDACRHASIHVEESVEMVQWQEAVKQFVVTTNRASYTCRQLVIATGGKSYPTLGTTGDGYAFAASLGHSIVPVKPALTGIVTRNKQLTALQGISVDHVEITVENKLKKFKGALLFTHFGLSGPVIINNSRSLDRGDWIRINFTSMSPDELDQMIQEMARLQGDKPCAMLYNHIQLPEALKTKLLEQAEFNRETKLAVLSKNQRKWLVDTFTRYEMEIESLIGFNQAMVTSGGVSTDEVDAKSMSSKMNPALYCVGEVLDVDGDTGGYNLQWAFSSGYLAAHHIQKRHRDLREEV